jgi:tetratricopeptide (TPR) repeat protein
MGKLATDCYEEVLQMDAQHLSAIPTPYYSIGVIDWTLAYRANVELRREFNQTVGGEGLKDSEPLPEALRIDYLQQCGSIVDEGIASLKQAINLNPDDDDAMTYLQLLYRRKADMAATPRERENRTNQADELLDCVKELQQQKATMPAQPNP